MERNDIAEMARKMETKEDLLLLLNRMKQDEMEELGMSNKFHPFTINHINYYCNPNHVFHRFRQFKIKKKTGGFRTITTPRNKSYMLILSYINEILKSLYTPSSYAMGFTEGRSVKTNAECHKGMFYILNLDLKDFFPSIEQPRVWKRLQLKPFEFPSPIANIIAGLVSMRETRNMPDGTRMNFFVLPQGSPTSPIITNMICDKLDRRLSGLAKRFGLNYTRYADDITFSSKHNVYQNGSDFLNELHRIITDQGFTVNEEKTRLQKLGTRQEVTGIIVSNKLNVTQKYVRNIRNILYIWDRYGYSTAYSKFFAQYMIEKGHIKKGVPNLINVLDGKLMYLKMVKGEEDSVYTQLSAKYKRLVAEICNFGSTTEESITYIKTTSVQEFEVQNKTEVIFRMSNPKVNEDGIITKPTHRYSYFLLHKKKIYASINKSINKEEFPQKEELSISLCCDAHHEQFWLIHKSDKITVPSIETVNIDALNCELDDLLEQQNG
jgi:hypothetical protein